MYTAEYTVYIGSWMLFLLTFFKGHKESHWCVHVLMKLLLIEVAYCMLIFSQNLKNWCCFRIQINNSPNIRQNKDMSPVLSPTESLIKIKIEGRKNLLQAANEGKWRSESISKKETYNGFQTSALTRKCIWKYPYIYNYEEVSKSFKTSNFVTRQQIQ